MPVHKDSLFHRNEDQKEKKNHFLAVLDQKEITRTTWKFMGNISWTRYILSSSKWLHNFFLNFIKRQTFYWDLALVREIGHMLRFHTKSVTRSDQLKLFKITFSNSEMVKGIFNSNWKQKGKREDQAFAICGGQRNQVIKQNGLLWLSGSCFFIKVQVNLWSHHFEYITFIVNS